MLRKRDKIILRDGSLGKVEDVVHTELKTIYKIRFIDTLNEGYFEEDKLILFQRHPVNAFINVFASLLRLG
jgi:hypothetical protein